MRSAAAFCAGAVVLLQLLAQGANGASLASIKHHHHHKKHHHGKHHHKKVMSNQTAASVAMAASSTAANASSSKSVVKQETQAEMVAKMKSLESELASKMQAASKEVGTGRLHLNGPLPADFNERFQQAVAKATGCDPTAVLVTSTAYLSDSKDVMNVEFKGPVEIVHSVEDQAADPDSKLATGSLKEFLVAKDDASSETPVQEKGIDVDTEMPYGELEPFGREDTAQEMPSVSRVATGAKKEPEGPEERDVYY